MNLRSKITYAIIGITSLLLLISLYFYLTTGQKIKNINSYADCQKAGFPVLESYPGQCKTPDGKTYTEEIGNELEKKDLIMIDSPRPNQKIVTPFVIKGRARGTWFFEGSFPIKVIDEGGFLLDQVSAQAVGEWMTEDFVDFTAELTFEIPSGKKGMIIFEKANPSDLPENADQLELPVVF